MKGNKKNNLLWVINRYKDPNYGDIGICRSINDFLIRNEYRVRNFDMIGKKWGFQFTRIFFIFSNLFLILKEKPILMVVGGGQLLLNNRSFPYGVLGWYLVSQITRVPLIVFSVGTEKNLEVTLFYRLVVRLLLGHAKKVYLRDNDTSDTIQRITGIKYETVPDAVYLSYNNKLKIKDCDPTGNSAVIYIQKFRKNSNNSHKYFDLILKTAKKEIFNLGLEIIVSASSKQDLESAKKFHKYTQSLGHNFKIEIPSSFNNFISQISKSKVVISSRMHPLIYAHMMQKKFVAVPINQKTRSMADFLKLNNPDILADEVRIKLYEVIKNI